MGQPEGGEGIRSVSIWGSSSLPKVEENPVRIVYQKTLHRKGYYFTAMQKQHSSDSGRLKITRFDNLEDNRQTAEFFIKSGFGSVVGVPKRLQ